MAVGRNCIQCRQPITHNGWSWICGPCLELAERHPVKAEQDVEGAEPFPRFWPTDARGRPEGFWVGSWRRWTREEFGTGELVEMIERFCIPVGLPECPYVIVRRMSPRRFVQLRAAPLQLWTILGPLDNE